MPCGIVKFCAYAQSEVQFARITLAKQTSLRSNFTAVGNFTCPKGKLSSKKDGPSGPSFFGTGVLLGSPANVLADGAAASLADPCHSLGSLYLPPAALPSLPGLSPAVRVRFQQRINPIVNVSFTMGFIGAGDRTRTGTPVTARDFKSLVSTYSTTPA